MSRKTIKKKKQKLRLNMAQSLDGHIIQPDGHWKLGSAEDKRRMDMLRKWADALIYSRKSLMADNPNLFIRRNPKSGLHPVPIIVSFSGKPLPQSLRVFQKPHPSGEYWIHKSNFSKHSLPKSWKIYSFETVADIVHSLKERNFYHLLLEGGGYLNGLFLQENLIDEIFMTLVPYVWGGQSTDRMIVTKSFLQEKKLRLLSFHRRSDEIFLRYKIIP
ncbi:MAG: hypothetical protein D6767_02250 [Candidatus Hydrogenedentota bacterium]|nr:MAG: hypothetical protein D6767_02250 [Candidatus Hydrogenedentota bacterium]